MLVSLYFKGFRMVEAGIADGLVCCLRDALAKPPVRAGQARIYSPAVAAPEIELIS